MNDRRRAIMGMSKSRLPNAYQEVEYLKSTGEQYIDTGFKPNNNTTYNLSGVFTQQAGTARMGARTGQAIAECTINSVGSNQLRISYGNQQVLTNKSGDITNVLLDGYTKKAVFTYADTSIQTVILNTRTFQTNCNCFIFAYNNDSNIVWATDMLVCACRIYDNNVLIRDFIPCYRKSDNKPGLYDLVNSKKNLIDMSTLGYHDVTGASVMRYGVEAKNLPAGTYTLSFNQNSYNATEYLTVHDLTLNTYSHTKLTETGTTSTLTFTLTNESDVIFRVEQKIWWDEVGFSNIQLEEGQFATSYEPYPFYTNANTSASTDFIVG